jgi:hypothetical protein
MKFLKAADSDKSSGTVDIHENVVNKLVQRIRTIEMNYVIMEKFTSQVAYFH